MADYTGRIAQELKLPVGGAAPSPNFLRKDAQSLSSPAIAKKKPVPSMKSRSPRSATGWPESKNSKSGARRFWDR